MVSYKVLLADNIPIYKFGNNKIVNTSFVLFEQSDLQDQTICC